MRRCSFEHDAALRAGVVQEDTVVDLSVVAPELPRDVVALLAAGQAALARARSAAESAREQLPLASLRLEPPTLRHHTAWGMEYLRDPAGNFAEHTSDLDVIDDEEAWRVASSLPAHGLAAWGPPVPREFLAPPDILALATGGKP